MDTFAGRQYEWMSSATPTVNPEVVACSFMPVMTTSQFPAVGVPLPLPTFVPESSGITSDWSAAGVVPKATGWVNTDDHSFTIDAMGSPPRHAARP